MNRKYLISFIAGLSFVALVGATFKSLMLDESGNCAQSVNFTGTTTLNSAAIATQAYSDGLVSSHNSDGSAHADKLKSANNLSDVSSTSTARSNLGLGTAATQTVGTSAGNVVQLDGSAKLPAVDGSALTNLPASGESNTASNVGTGTGVFAQKSGVDLQFKSLIAGTNIEITYDSTGITIAATGSASGEANTASNIGVGGVGVFAQKSGVDLQFKNIIAGSNKVLVSDDTADSEIAIDVQPGNIAHQDLSGAGTNTHTQIDSHISSTSNPHSVTASQAGAVATSGDETVAGVKTFSSSPIVPTPTTDYQAATKKYVDDNAGSGGGLSWNKITSSTTASSGNGYLIDPAAAVTLTLPATPTAGDQVGVKAIDLDYAVVVARNSSNIEGAASDMNIDVSGAGFTLVYVDATTGWTVVDAIPTSTASSSAGGLSAYGFVYRTSAKDLAATGTWYNIEMDSNGPLSNITHSTSTNTERITVSATGVYEISYNVTVHRDSSGHHNNTRILVNGTTEVAGSFTSQGINSSDSNELQNISKTVMASLSANDYITVQITTNVSVTNEIYAWDDANTADPTTMTYSSISIKKLN